jgi:hypothetical protein
MSGPTKGPWSMKDRRTKDGIEIVSDSEGLSIACVEAVDVRDEALDTFYVGDETRANASLFMSAIGLLEALELLVEGEGDCRYDHHGNCQEHGLRPKGSCEVELARKAIAKARGDVVKQKPTRPDWLDNGVPVRIHVSDKLFKEVFVSVDANGNRVDVDKVPDDLKGTLIHKRRTYCGEFCTGQDDCPFCKAERGEG